MAGTRDSAAVAATAGEMAVTGREARPRDTRFRLSPSLRKGQWPHACRKIGGSSPSPGQNLRWATRRGRPRRPRGSGRWPPRPPSHTPSRAPSAVCPHPDRPQPSATASTPGPRARGGAPGRASDRRASAPTRPCTKASHNSNNASPRAIRHAYNSAGPLPEARCGTELRLNDRASAVDSRSRTHPLQATSLSNLSSREAGERGAYVRGRTR